MLTVDEVLRAWRLERARAEAAHLIRTMETARYLAERSPALARAFCDGINRRWASNDKETKRG